MVNFLPFLLGFLSIQDKLLTNQPFSLFHEETREKCCQVISLSRSERNPGNNGRKLTISTYCGDDSIKGLGKFCKELGQRPICFCIGTLPLFTFKFLLGIFTLQKHWFDRARCIKESTNSLAHFCSRDYPLSLYALLLLLMSCVISSYLFSTCFLLPALGCGSTTFIIMNVDSLQAHLYFTLSSFYLSPVWSKSSYLYL